MIITTPLPVSRALILIEARASLALEAQAQGQAAPAPARRVPNYSRELFPIPVTYVIYGPVFAKEKWLERVVALWQSI